MWFGAAVGARLTLQAARAPPSPSSSRVRVELAQHARHHAVGLLGERDQQMLGLDLRVIELRGQRLRGDDRFLRLFGELIQIHDDFSLLTSHF